MKFRTFFILITGSLLLMNCGGKRGEGIIGEKIHVMANSPKKQNQSIFFGPLAASRMPANYL